MAVQSGLCQTWSETPKTGFLTTRLKSCYPSFQFNAYMSLIKEMISRVETEHRGKLEQLDQMKQEQNKLEITKITENDDKTLISGVTDDQPQTMVNSVKIENNGNF